MKRELIDTIYSGNYQNGITDNLKREIIRGSFEALQENGLLDEFLNEFCLDVVMHQKGGGVHFRLREEKFRKESGDNG